jgi:hypothetical protein
MAGQLGSDSASSAATAWPAKGTLLCVSSWLSTTHMSTVLYIAGSADSVG